MTSQSPVGEETLSSQVLKVLNGIYAMSLCLPLPPCGARGSKNPSQHLAQSYARSSYTAGAGALGHHGVFRAFSGDCSSPCSLDTPLDTAASPGGCAKLLFSSPDQRASMLVGTLWRQAASGSRCLLKSVSYPSTALTPLHLLSLLLASRLFTALYNTFWRCTQQTVHILP